MKNTNQINVPEAREAMDKFKMEAASDLGVFLPLKKIPNVENSAFILCILTEFCPGFFVHLKNRVF